VTGQTASWVAAASRLQAAASFHGVWRPYRPAIGIGPNSAAPPCRLTAPDFRYWRFAARPRADHRAATAAESGDHAPDRGVWGRLGARATDLKLSHQLSAEVTADRVNNRIMDRPPQQRSQPGTE
jgi:hypothetical protein